MILGVFRLFANKTNSKNQHKVNTNNYILQNILQICSFCEFCETLGLQIITVRNLEIGSNFNGSKCSKLSYEQYSKRRGLAMAKRREAQAVRAKQLELCRADMSFPKTNF
jgi:hypothetical protein